jgi:hypothetical protein
MPLPKCLKKLYKPYDWEDFGKNYVLLGFADGSSGLYTPTVKTDVAELATGLKDCPDGFWYHHVGKPVYSPCGTGFSAEFRKVGRLIFVEVYGTGKNTHCLLVLKDGRILYKETLTGSGFGLRKRSKQELLAKLAGVV